MLEILGIVFLVIIIIIVLVVGTFIYKIARQASSYQKAASIMEAMPQENITLRQIDNPPWKNPDDIDYNKQQLENHGFNLINTYVIPEFGGVRMMAFVNNDTHAQAVIYEHPEVSVWVDLYVPYQDETSLTVSSVAEQGQLSRPEEHKAIARAGEDINTLLSLLEENILEKPIKIVNADNFVNGFEEAYSTEMKWRKENGYLNEDDLKKIAKSAGVKLSKKDIEAAKLIMGENELEDEIYELENECMSAFATKTKLNVAQWEKAREHLFVVHNKLQSEDVIGLVLEHADYENEDLDDQFYEHEDSSLSARELFEFLNNKLPSEKKINKLDEITTPISADLYYSNVTDY